MSVIVHKGENIELALKRLNRETLREKIIDTLRNKMYRTKRADDAIAKRREWKKRKRRRRAAARRAK